MPSLTPFTFAIRNVDTMDSDDLQEYLDETNIAIADLQKLAEVVKAKQRLKAASKDKYGGGGEEMMPKEGVKKPTTVEYHNAWNLFFALRDALPSSVNYVQRVLGQ